jgi:outer membrane protein OmpA-like peptidoglycan-associated protein
MKSSHSMRIFLLSGASALGLMLAAATPAAAQMYPGEDVTVNPNALGGPGSLVYPGGLLPPGATSRNLPPVHLHPPGEHVRHHARRRSHVARQAPQSQAPAETPAEAPAETPTEVAVAPTPAPAREAPPPPRPAARTASTGPAASPSAIPFSLDDSPAPAPKPPKAAPATPSRVASAEPLPKITPQPGRSKQAAVLFDADSATLSDTSTARLNDLAFSLKTALANGADHVELDAYAGTPGDKSSAARRLSLKRALSVREALIVDGVPAARINVRALGGVSDNGATDRVDIFVKA